MPASSPCQIGTGRLGSSESAGLERLARSCPPSDGGQLVSAAGLTLLFVACLALFFFRLGCCGFIDPGDGYFSEGSREMVESGDYVTPHLNYQVYFSKPILIYWLISSAYQMFGTNELSARLPSALLATVLVLACYYVMRSLAGTRAGVLSGLVLASSPLVVTFARMSLIDMTFSALLGVALCATVMTVILGSRRSWAAIYVSLALAVLAKGPAAVVLFGIGMAGYFLINRPDSKSFLALVHRLKLHLGIPIFLAIVLPWYIGVGLATKGLFLQVFFFFENLGRFAGHTNHHIPYWWFYLPVLAYGFFPWIAFVPAALALSLKSLRQMPGWQNVTLAHVAEQPSKTSAQAAVMFACWALGIALFFSASQTKLQTYILPAFPALAMLVGLCFDNWIRQAEGRVAIPVYLRVASFSFMAAGACLLLVCPVIAVILAAPQLTGVIHSHWSARLGGLLSEIPFWMRATAAIVLPLTGAGFVYQNVRLARQDIRGCIFGLTGTAVVACALAGPLAFELGYNYKQKDLHAVVKVLDDKVGPVAFFQDFKPSVIYCLRRPVDTFFSPDQLLPVTPPSMATGGTGILVSRRAKECGGNSKEPPGSSSGSTAAIESFQAVGDSGQACAGSALIPSTATAPVATQYQYVISGKRGAEVLLARFGSKLHLLSRQGDWYVFESTELRAQRLPTLEQTFSQNLQLSTDEFSWGTLPFAGGTKNGTPGH